MAKKTTIIYPFILILVLIIGCKPKGYEPTSLRKVNGYTMINPYGAMLKLKAYKDTTTYVGINSVKLYTKVYDISSTITIEKYGHCISLENKVPYLKKPNSTAEGEIIDTITEFTIGEAGIEVNPTDTAFEFISKIPRLFIDSVYYVRTYLILKNEDGTTDTAYNQKPFRFRTRIPEDTWFHKPDFNYEARTGAVSFMRNNKAYIGGGYNGIEILDDCWVYDPTGGTEGKGSWKNEASFPVKRTNAIAFSINDTTYFGTGISEFDPVTGTPTPNDDMYKLKPLNNWRRIDSIGNGEGGGSERYSAIAFSLRQKSGEITGYVGLGKRTSNFNDLYTYDPREDYPGNTLPSWINIDPLEIHISGAAVTTVRNRAVVIGGIDNNGNYSSRTYLYNPEASPLKRWKRLKDCPAPARTNGVALSLSILKNGKRKYYVYYGTGKNDQKLFRDWWRYDYTNDEWKKCAEIAENEDISHEREDAVAFAIKLNHVDFGQQERGFVIMGKTKDRLNNDSIISDVWEYLP